ncbi:replication-association protein [Human associated cyclovirus 7]|uniref:Replication-associated protein n=2 Tax=Cyclovirus TaxID=742914 RepID=D4N3Q8_9CIRC|nr:replication-association protein [Cyclovirus NG14]ADD62473.1 replication-association protein [Cyclovirus NG14]
MALADVRGMANSTVRRFCFTWNNYSELEYVLCCEFIKKYCCYGIVGKEIAPNTGTHHLQGFCNLEKPMRFSTIKKRLDSRIHIEKAAGSDSENQTYCSKTGNFFESGTPNQQGRRTDLQAVVSAIQNGEITTPKMVAELHGAVYIKYHRGIEKILHQLHPVPPRDIPTELRVYWGPPGSGKSRRALEEARTLGGSIYYKPRGLWWDGYEQQNCVIIDDFYGWIKYDELLKICDRYPYKVQIKGSFQEFTSKYIFITSNVDTCDWYKFAGYNVNAIERRITIKEYMD